jgi:hypothetical protein
MTEPRATKLALLAASALLLAGCTQTHTVPSNRTVQIELGEYRLTPQNLRASAGLLTIVVHNRGVLEHNLVVSENGAAVDSIKPIAPGQTTQMTLEVAPGTYGMASTVQSDQALGEYGTLKVTS